MKQTIAIINESTVLQDSAILEAIPDLQVQISRDFAPRWGADATLVFVPKGQKPDLSHWWLTILDDSDQAGALGYHDLTDGGLPLAKVFAKSDVQDGLSWTVTISHELLEMLGDPYINECTQEGQVFYAKEACDACEQDSFGYMIDKTKVSDFVFPSWFCSSAPGPYDFTGCISAPLQLREGGYIGIFNPGQGWSQKTADLPPGADFNKIMYSSRPRLGSRRERRQHSQMDRIRSSVL